MNETLQIPIGQSTLLHLQELAKANEVTVEAMLSKMADCLADAAGRRPGSWEAAAVDGFITGNGYKLGDWVDTSRMDRLVKSAVAGHS